MSFFKKLLSKEEPFPFVPTPTQDVPGLDPLVVHAVENLFPDADVQKQAFDFSLKFLDTKKGNIVSLLAVLKMGILEIDSPAFDEGRFWMEASYEIPNIKAAKRWVKSITKSQDQYEQKLQELISQLHNGNDRQRRALSYKLSKSKDPAAVSVLIQAYNDTDSSVRQNAINGLRAIGTQEALDFLNSQKEKLSENISFAIDGGMLKRTADGLIILGSNPTVMTWIGVVFWGVLALGLLALMIRSFLEGSGFDSGILALLVPTGLFGYLTFSAYQRTQHGQIVIDPTTHTIKSRKREINFDDIETIVTKQTTIPLGGAGIKVTFLALVTKGNPLILGSISGIDEIVEKKGAQIINLLVEQGFTVKQ